MIKHIGDEIQPVNCYQSGPCSFYSYKYSEIDSWALIDYHEFKEWGVGYYTLYTMYAAVNEGHVGFWEHERPAIIALGGAQAILKESTVYSIED